MSGVSGVISIGLLSVIASQRGTALYEVVYIGVVGICKFYPSWIIQN